MQGAPHRSPARLARPSVPHQFLAARNLHWTPSVSKKPRFRFPERPAASSQADVQDTAKEEDLIKPSEEPSARPEVVNSTENSTPDAAEAPTPPPAPPNPAPPPPPPEEPPKVMAYNADQYSDFFRKLASSVPHVQRPTKDDFLNVASGFWERAKIRFKWFTIRSFRKFNSDDISAFVSIVLMSQTLWIFVGTCVNGQSWNSPTELYAEPHSFPSYSPSQTL